MSGKKKMLRTEHLTTIPVIVPRGGEAWKWQQQSHDLDVDSHIFGSQMR